MASGFVMRGQGQLVANVATFEPKVKQAITAIVEYTGLEATGQMRSGARWTDQTGAARSGLHHDTLRTHDAWILVLAHAVNYGIWLETRNDFHGKYAIILRVLIDSANRLMARLEGLFGKMI
jgi:hypothetical protein